MAGVSQTIVADPKVTAEVTANDAAGDSLSDSIRPQKRQWYRTTLFNAFVIGGVGFTAPGLWNAMNSLGAGGQESPELVNAANALVRLGHAWMLPSVSTYHDSRSLDSWASCVYSVDQSLTALA